MFTKRFTIFDIFTLFTRDNITLNVDKVKFLIINSIVLHINYFNITDESINTVFIFVLFSNHKNKIMNTFFFNVINPEKLNPCCGRGSPESESLYEKTIIKTCCKKRNYEKMIKIDEEIEEISFVGIDFEEMLIKFLCEKINNFPNKEVIFKIYYYCDENSDEKLDEKEK